MDSTKSWLRNMFPYSERQSVLTADTCSHVTIQPLGSGMTGSTVDTVVSLCSWEKCLHIFQLKVVSDLEVDLCLGAPDP